MNWLGTITLTYQGSWGFPGREFREFQLTLKTGQKVNISLLAGQCLKERLTELLKRFVGGKAA